MSSSVPHIKQKNIWADMFALYTRPRHKRICAQQRCDKVLSFQRPSRFAVGKYRPLPRWWWSTMTTDPSRLPLLLFARHSPITRGGQCRARANDELISTGPSRPSWWSWGACPCLSKSEWGNQSACNSDSQLLRRGHWRDLVCRLWMVLHAISVTNRLDSRPGVRTRSSIQMVVHDECDRGNRVRTMYYFLCMYY